jgi:glycerate kinase
VTGSFARLDDGRAALEVAAACGLELVHERRRDVLRATSRGAGELISAAVSAGPPEIIVGVGGTASNDGGVGAAGSLGWRFLDGRGRELSDGGGALPGLRRIDGDRADERLDGVRIIGACDVDNELLGPEGAARAFGPQKGASPRDVELLEDGLSNLADRIREDLGIDVGRLEGAGAGGGLGAGLAAFFGARLRAGFELIADAAGLERELASADLVVTGEGKLDAQSGGGKAPVALARLARAAGTRCVAVAGAIEVAAARLDEWGFAAAASLVEEVGARRAREDAARALTEVTERLLRSIPADRTTATP